MAQIELVSASSSSISLKITGMSSTYAYGRKFHWYCTNSTEKWGTPVTAYATVGGNVTFSGLSANTSYGFRCHIYNATTESQISVLPSTTTFDYFSTTESTTYNITLIRGNGIASIGGTYYLTSSSSGTSFTLSSQTMHTFSGFSSTGYIYLDSITKATGYSNPVYGNPALQGGDWTIINSSGTWADHYMRIKSGSYGPGDRNITVRATQTTPSYTLSLGYCTGSSSKGTVSQSGGPTYPSGSYVTATATANSGYVFDGWWYDQSASQLASYSNPFSFYIYSNTTLYAKFSNASTSYTLSYSANGGSGAPSSQTKTSSTGSATFQVSSTIPTRTNYDFDGWSWDSSASTATIFGGDYVTISSNRTLYAVWSYIAPKYQLSYYTEYGTAPSGGWYYGGTVVTVGTDPSQSPTSEQIQTNINFLDTDSSLLVQTTQYNTRNTTYAFNGWYANGSGSAYHGGDQYTMPHNNVTMYANWSTTSSTTWGIVTMPNATKAGRTLLGWSTSSSASTPQYVVGQQYRLQGITTLYAVWELMTYDYYVHYKYNYGGRTEDFYTQSFIGSTQTSRTFYAVNGPTSFIYYGYRYVFNHWNDEPDDNGRSYSPGDPITLYSSSPTENLYAIYTKQPVYTYTLTYNANGGSGSVPETQTATTTNTSYTFTIRTSPTPTWSGHEFLGWSTNPSAEEPLPGPTITLLSTHPNETLYAIWRTTWVDINRFYWTNNDASIIISGAPVNLLTASRWNAIYAKINECRTKNGQSAIDFSSHYVSQNGRIMAFNYNDVNDALFSYAGGSSNTNIPNDVSSGDIIVPSQFINTKSLKGGVNWYVDYINNLHH